MKKKLIICISIMVIGIIIISITSIKKDDNYTNVGNEAYEQSVLNSQGEFELVDGSYVVNVHIPSGEYKVVAKDKSMTIKVLDSENNETDFSDIKVGDTLKLDDESRIIMVSGGTLVLK